MMESSINDSGGVAKTTKEDQDELLEGAAQTQIPATQLQSTTETVSKQVEEQKGSNEAQITTLQTGTDLPTIDEVSSTNSQPHN